METESNSFSFERDIIEPSHKKPVVVDFWASWCQPCKALTPVLEKLEKEFKPDFSLVKIDTEQYPEIAQKMGISGIPHVQIYIDGALKDSFTGALSESLIIEFLTKNIPDPEQVKILEIAETDLLKAVEVAINSTINSPEIYRLYSDAIKYHLCNQNDNYLEKINQLIQLLPKFGHPSADLSRDLPPLLGSNFWGRFAKETAAALSPDTQENNQMAMEKIFTAFQDSSDEEEKAFLKSLVLLIFRLWGDTNPLTIEFRKRLSRLLF